MIVIALFAIWVIDFIHSGGFTQNKMPNTNTTVEPKNQITLNHDYLQST
jgi:hypothetical protein